ncbi:hypothetical protein GCM10011504_19970 [Siccirubricoccus deserti]|uniref:Uncharacterized protein n=1 Tax=Siccirubricoccus deserti TaxID=2013562 RepID=A0A9X0QZA5_9PROT|nr:hypothetical protein [Siccirubricoccus deserti]MBC4015422.1 hypothetical protein [Siccirubricoccus deserti]GGC41532.1 hypothetical protein GCM10011504_19970 [Siccirubricoccus deserti]
MSKITVLSDSDLDAVTGAWGGYTVNVVKYSGNGGTAISGVATGNINYSGVYIGNYKTGDANANGAVVIDN